MHRQPTSSKHIRVESIRNWNGRTQNSGGEMSDFVDVLRQSIEKLIDEKQQLTKERDEALSQRDAERREYCELCAPEWGLPSPQWLAKDKGWDCYKEKA
jgi:hypothetical protein